MSSPPSPCEFICPHCKGRMDYAHEHHGMDSQCPHCHRAIVLGASAESSSLQLFVTTKPVLEENKKGCNEMVGFWRKIIRNYNSEFALYTFYAVVCACSVFIAIFLMTHLSALPSQEQMPIPQVSQTPSTWTSASNGRTWNAASEDEKMVLCNALAGKSKHGVSASTFYDGLNTFYSTSDNEKLGASLDFTAQYIEQSENPDNYK